MNKQSKIAKKRHLCIILLYECEAYFVRYASRKEEG